MASGHPAGMHHGCYLHTGRRGRRPLRKVCSAFITMTVVHSFARILFEPARSCMPRRVRFRKTGRDDTERIFRKYKEIYVVTGVFAVVMLHKRKTFFAVYPAENHGSFENYSSFS